MIEAKLGLLEMQLELVASHAMKLHQPMLGIAPERLDAVDMPGDFDEFVVAVIDPKVLLQTQINPSIVGSSAIGVNDAVRIHFTPNNALQRGFEGIGDDSGIDTTASLEQTKDDGFTACATSAFASDTLGGEIGLIGFKLARERRLRSAFLGQADTDALVHRIDRAHGMVTQLRDIRGSQVHGKQAQKMSKLGITDFSMAVTCSLKFGFAG